MGLVRAQILVVELIFLLVIVVILGELWILVLLLLLLELPYLQTPKVDEEDETGSHRHEQVPLLGLHVCCGGGGKGGDGGSEGEWRDRRVREMEELRSF